MSSVTILPIVASVAVFFVSSMSMAFVPCGRRHVADRRLACGPLVVGPRFGHLVTGVVVIGVFSVVMTGIVLLGRIRFGVVNVIGRLLVGRRPNCVRYLSSPIVFAKPTRWIRVE